MLFRSAQSPPPATENRPAERGQNQGNRGRGTRRGRRGGRRRRRYEGGQESANRPASPQENPPQNRADTIPNFTGAPPSDLPPPAPIVTQVETRPMNEPPSKPMETPQPREFTPRVDSPRINPPRVDAPREETPRVETPRIDTPRQDPTVPLYRAREQGDVPATESSEPKPPITDTESHSE